MTNYKLLMFLAALMIPLAARAQSADSACGGTLSVAGAVCGYMNNLEYFNPYREGTLYLGTNFSLRAVYSPADQLEFHAGVFARKAVGDERFFSDIRPLFKARFSRGVFALTIGELDWQGRHGLPDALMREQYDFEKGIEEGFQLRWHWPAVDWDLWMACDSLNTARHREHLRFGSVSAACFEPVTARIIVHWDHYGGQNYAPAGDPVRDNWIGGAEARGVVKGKGVLDEIGVGELLLASFATPDRGEVEISRGWGSASQAWVTLHGFELLLAYWRSNGFETWQGNPMYRTKGPWYQVQLSRQRSWQQGVTLDWGVRLDILDDGTVEPLSNLEHQVWVRMDALLGRRLL